MQYHYKKIAIPDDVDVCSTTQIIEHIKQECGFSENVQKERWPSGREKVFYYPNSNALNKVFLDNGASGTISLYRGVGDGTFRDRPSNCIHVEWSTQ